MAWYNESRRHSMSAKGIKNAQKIPKHTLRSLVIKTDEVQSSTPFDWKSMKFKDKLNLVREAGLVDGIADKRLGELTVNEVKWLTQAMQRREHTSESQLKQIRERNIKMRQEMSPTFKSKSDKEKGIRVYQTVPKKEEVMRLVKNLVEIDDKGRKILKMPSSRLDFKTTYIFEGFTKSGSVKLREPDGFGGRKRIAKPYVFHGDLYIQTDNHSYILDLQKGD